MAVTGPTGDAGVAAPGPGGRRLPDEASFVFNVVWTGTVFDHLQDLVASQIRHSDARFRFVANACPVEEIAAMEDFAAAHPDQVVEVLEVSTERMLRHGAALDEILRLRDDGEFFCLIDPDIVAKGPFLDRFRGLLVDHDAVTSGKEVWSDHNVRPAEHPGVNGEYFFDQDGYVFGSPHLAIYRRAPLVETMERWDIGFAAAGKEIPEATRARLDEVGRSYWVYDTGKVVNILFQEDGHPLCHEEHPDLLHIGGVAHFLAPPSSAPAARDKPPVWGEGPDWGDSAPMRARAAVAGHTAEVMRALRAGQAVPPLPDDVDPGLHDRLVQVRTALVELAVGSEAPPAPPSGSAGP